VAKSEESETSESSSHESEKLFISKTTQVIPPAKNQDAEGHSASSSSSTDEKTPGPPEGKKQKPSKSESEEQEVPPEVKAEEVPGTSNVTTPSEEVSRNSEEGGAVNH